MMSEITNEPTMEDILSSIKKIIADDSAKTLAQPRQRRVPPREPLHDELPEPAPAPVAAAPVEEEDVLELTEETMAPEQIAEIPTQTTPTALVSPKAEVASRTALDALSSLVVKPEVTGSDTLEGMVREMLRPMLRDWLDANLPDVVERLVSKEIARISGK